MLHDSSNGINPPKVEEDVAHQLDGLERHLGTLQKQVEQLQRLASLGTVCAMVAHEFNNALTPIVSYCKYALDRDDGDLTRTAVEKTLKNAQRLTVLCRRVLGMAIDDQMGPANTPIRPLVTDAVECLGRALEKDEIVLALDVPEDLEARATAGSLQQVLFNLVINARQAMLGRPGTLRVSARAAPDGKVSIEVSDTGVGIRPEDHEKVFEPFFTTRRHTGGPEQPGIGLGLYICRQLMEEQGGSISVAGKPGEGTTFTLTLPGAA